MWDYGWCFPLDPEPALPGQPCTVESEVGGGADSCDLDSMCWGVDPQTGLGECVLRCTGSADLPSCPDGTTCVIANDETFILCLPPCDPLAQDCPAGEACLPGGDAFACIHDASGDEGQVFDLCDYQNSCDPGLYCLGPELASECDDPNAIGCCLPFCDIDAPNACPGAMQECLAWFEEGMAPAGHERVGVCGLPQ